MRDDIVTILGVMIAIPLNIAILVIIGYLIYNFLIYLGEEEHYQKVYEEGVDFLDSLQQEGLTPLKFAKLPESEKQEHFSFYELDAGRIKEFIMIVIAMPTFPTINARVVDLWWPEYKITRQSLRRFPKRQ